MNKNNKKLILFLTIFIALISGCSGELFERKNDYCIVAGRHDGHFVCNANTKNNTCDVRHPNEDVRGLVCAQKLYFYCIHLDREFSLDPYLSKENQLICSEGVLKNAADYQILYAYDNKNSFILDHSTYRHIFKVNISPFVSTYPMIIEENYPQKYKDAAEKIEKEKIESMRKELIELNKKQLEQHYENKNQELERLKNL